MIALTAIFDKVGRFQPTEGKERDALTAHYLIGKRGDPISGGIYLPKDMAFPSGGILIRLKEGRG